MIDGKIKTFVDALKDDTIIKMDVAIVVNDLFVDLTEVYQYKQKPISKDKIVAELEADVQKYYRSNTMKSCKRLYSYLTATNKKKKLQKELLKLFNSELGYANKLMNDIAFFIDVCEKHDIDMDTIKKMSQLFKEKYFKIEWSNNSFMKRLNGVSKSNYLKVFGDLKEDIRSSLNPRVKEAFSKMH
jgi:hypothetical protein